MRSRNIKPGFFKNEDLAALPPLARVLFLGLWCLADREGRLYDRPKRLKVEILPYDNCDVDSMLARLAEAKFIRRYSDELESYIDIPKFKCHQNPHPNEKASQIPAYNDIVKCNCEFVTNRADILIPDIMNHDTTLPRQDAGAFEQFWEKYPRKQGKGKARESWKQAVRKARPSDIIAALESQLGYLSTLERQFQPMPTTWLNQERWADDLTIARPRSTFVETPREPEMTEEQRAASLQAARESFEQVKKLRFIGKEMP